MAFLQRLPCSVSLVLLTKVMKLGEATSHRRGTGLQRAHCGGYRSQPCAVTQTGEGARAATEGLFLLVVRSGKQTVPPLL